MKNVLTIGLFFLVINSTAAQDEKIVHFGFNISPSITKVLFENTDNIVSEQLFGYSFGINVFYDVSTIFEIKSGINYHVHNLNPIDYSPIAGCDIHPIEGTNLLSSWYEDQYRIHSIGIPIEARFKILGNENHFYAKTGFEPLFKIAESGKSVFVECNMNEYDLTNTTLGKLVPILYKVKFGLGFEFELTKKINLYIEPEISYAINKTFEARTNNNRILNFGLLMGTRI